VDYVDPDWDNLYFEDGGVLDDEDDVEYDDEDDDTSL